MRDATACPLVEDGQWLLVSVLAEGRDEGCSRPGGRRKMGSPS